MWAQAEAMAGAWAHRRTREHGTGLVRFDLMKRNHTRIWADLAAVIGLVVVTAIVFSVAFGVA